MKITIVEGSGFCFGVQRAMDMIEKAYEEGLRFDTLGPIIHNPFVVKDLESRGIRAVDSLDQTDKKIVVVRTHGVPPEVYEEAEKKGIKLLDTTCPFVFNAQSAARRLVEEGYDPVIVVGKKEHPEVIGILGHAWNKPVVVGSPEEVEKLNIANRRVGILSQTTMTFDLFASCVRAAMKYAKEVHVINTRCATTERRQKATMEVAQKVDVMVVIGGKNSSNTKRLHEIASKYTRSYHIEHPDELKEEWFDGVENVGVAAGASTPPWLIEAVVKRIKEIGS